MADGVLNQEGIAKIISKPKKLLDQVRDVIRLKHYSQSTEKIYVHWIKKFIHFHNKRHPKEMGITEIEAFLKGIEPLFEKKKVLFPYSNRKSFIFSRESNRSGDKNHSTSSCGSDPPGNRTQNNLIKIYAIISPSPTWRPLWLQGGRCGGENVYSIYYFHSFYSVCNQLHHGCNILLRGRGSLT